MSLAISSISSLLCIFSGVQGQEASPTVQHVGTMFIFDPGQGACGFTNTPSQLVASVSSQVFNTFPGATTNPNKNPICKHSVLITYDGKNVTAPIVDHFTGSGQDNVGVSRPGFVVFAPESDGIVQNVTWIIN